VIKSFQNTFLKGLHMFNATLTTKGQTTIPIEVREGLKLQPQDKLNFTLLPDGTVIMRTKKRSLTELVGIAGYTGAKVSLAKMKSARAA
jgi:antitoxin PrlF